MIERDDDTHSAGATPTACASGLRPATSTDHTGRSVADHFSIGIAVAVKTTGPDLETDALFELALRRFRYDSAGLILEVDAPYDWLEDPGQAIPETITRRTGVDAITVAGKRIDDAVATYLLRSADLVVARGASLVRPWVDTRLPHAGGCGWACTSEEIDWRDRGIAGLAAGMPLELEERSRRAGQDVDAVLTVLRQVFDDGRTALSVLIENAMRPSWNVRAWGARDPTEESMRLAGYQWSSEDRVWMKHVVDRDREAAWLAQHVYGTVRNCSDARPSWALLSRFTRHA